MPGSETRTARVAMAEEEACSKLGSSSRQGSAERRTTLCRYDGEAAN
jgi:hypothetical protein